MNVTDIVALAKAGFTAEQITALAAPAQQAAAPAQQASAPEQPAQTEQPAQMDYTALMSKLDALATTLQASAIFATNQPKSETVDDILANIIAPPHK